MAERWFASSGGDPASSGPQTRYRDFRSGSMAVDRDVLAYVCYTPEQRTSVCRPELGRNMPLGDSRLLDRSRRFTAVVDPMRALHSYKVPKAAASSSANSADDS